MGFRLVTLGVGRLARGMSRNTSLSMGSSVSPSMSLNTSPSMSRNESVASDDGSDHAPTVPLTSDPGQHPVVFAAAFNSGRPDLLAQVYEEGAVFVPRSGTAVTGAELHRANAEFQALGVPITVRPRHTYVAGDLALLVVDWVMDGFGPDGKHHHIEGTATDVARRGADGLWRYVIDSPFGVGATPAVP